MSVSQEQIETLKEASLAFSGMRDPQLHSALHATIETCERLPEFEDTGERFVPERDDAWTIGLFQGVVKPVGVITMYWEDGRWIGGYFYCGDGGTAQRFFSTEKAAAEAAKEAGGE
jgi:hypothetical protein